MPLRHLDRTTIAASFAALSLAAVAGCSSSSSGGTPNAGGSTTPSPSGSVSTVAKTPNAVGPAGQGKGQLTAPATIAPTKGAPSGSEVFPHVTASQRKHLQAKVAKLAGVQTVTYYPQFQQLQVYFTKDVTADQRAAVARAVTGS